MGNMSIINRALFAIRWADGILALALAPLLAARVSRYRQVVPLGAYEWSFAVAFALSLAWWGLLLYGFDVLTREGAWAAISAREGLPATLLAAEAGLAGFIALPTPWKSCSLAFAILSGLLLLALGALALGMRPPQ